MKKSFKGMLILLALAMLLLVSCQTKNITVIVREASSGTKDAFDSAVNIKDEEITREAIIHNKTGLVLTSVMEDRNAIGYISVTSVNDDISVVKVNGVMPTDDKILNGSYPIQRPFVIMTTKRVPLTVRAEDFLKYLKSSNAQKHCKEAGTIYLKDPTKRGGNGIEPIKELEYVKQPSLPMGEKIVIRGSTSMEKLISSIASGYAELYGANASELFDIELQGSSVGKASVENDGAGNVIGLSSVSVEEKEIESFNICLDAVAVIVNKRNKLAKNLTIEQIRNIFKGEIKGFDKIGSYDK